MSMWTHVAGVIRVDAIRGLLPTPDFKKIFIKSLWNQRNKNCNMPMGSEGSLDFRIIENPYKASIAAYTVVIFGDLRDFGEENVHEIEEWWNRVLKECGMIRQAVLQIQPEYGQEVILRYSEDEDSK